jgi:Tfp pilus assembly protein PilF
VTGFPHPAPTPGQIRIHQIKQRVFPLLDAQQFELAASLLEDVLPLDRRDAMLHKMLGFCYANLQRTDKASLHLRRAAELGMRDADTLVALAANYRDTGDLRGAMRVIDKLLAESPNEPKAIDLKARMLRSMGDAEGAFALLDAAKARGAWRGDLSILKAELLRRDKRFNEALEEVRGVLADAGCPESRRRDALFESGHILDAMGDYDAAFEAFTRANSTLDEVSIIPIDEFRAVWSAEKIAKIPEIDEPTERPLFVIGMPRSGTTLTEQILAAHPKIGSVGESDAMTMLVRSRHATQFFEEKAVRAITEGYLERTASARFAKMQRVVDKMPENFYFVPIIRRALPGASIVHCTRDARDTCLSCFMQNFGTRLTWSRRIETCARQFVLYRRIMDHWAEVVEAEILESNYERLTRDPRPQVEALLRHAKMPFDPACLAHHKQKATVQTASVDQVREPIYTRSQERWKRYEKHLGPMLEILEGF